MYINKKDNMNPKINRDAYYSCIKYIEGDEWRLITLLGQRRLGKTTILKTINNNYNNSIMITMSEYDKIEELVDLIQENLDKYDIFLIDEFGRNMDTFSNAQIISEILINSRKKAIITSTHSTSLKLMEKDQFYGRVRNIDVDKLSILEFNEIFETKDYLKYLEFTDFNNTYFIDYVEQLKDDIFKSINRYLEYTSSSIIEENQFGFYLDLILLKLVWSEKSKLNEFIKLEGLNKHSDLNKILIEDIRNKNRYYGIITVNDILWITEILESLGIIKTIKGITPESEYKVIIMDYTLKFYVYKEIEKALKTGVDIFRKVHYGITYENIMNIQVAMSNHEQFYYKTDTGEVDDIIDMGDYYLVADYKLGDIRKNYTFEKDSDLMKEFSRISLKPVKCIYVSDKKTQGEILNDLEFLKIIRKDNKNKAEMEWI